MEEYNLRVFLMVTYSNVGALPLGIIITSDETTTTLIQALDMFKLCLPRNAFNGVGPDQGPAVVMTDSCSELRDALSKCWPSVVLLLCVFHMMQQVWRWLFEKTHCITQNDRPKIMILFKKVVYASTVQEMEDLFEELIESDVVCKYANLCAYLNGLYDIREAWALGFRSNLRLRGNNTNNAIESQFLVIKDDVLNRTKEVNINALLEKLLNNLENHYQVKLLNIASGKFDGTYSSRFKGISKKKGESIGFRIPDKDTLSQIAANVISLGGKLFQVPSFDQQDTTYSVDMNVGICECENGRNGSVCKHQFLLWSQKGISGRNFIPYLNPSERKEIAFLAIGTALNDEYYEGIHDRMERKHEWMRKWNQIPMGLIRIPTQHQVASKKHQN